MATKMFTLSSKIFGICLALLLSLDFFLGLVSCSKLYPSMTIVLDNPTKETISCNIDGKDYEVTPRGHIDLQLTEGEHYLVYDRFYGGDTVSFVVQKGDDGSILNPTGSTYVVWDYSFGPIKDIICDDDFGTEINGKVYYGPYTPLNGLYLKRADGRLQGKWYFGLDASVPNATPNTYLPFMKEGKEYLVGKIFRYEDFRLAEQTR